MKTPRIKSLGLALACGFLIVPALLLQAQTVIYSDNFNIPDTTSLDGSAQAGRHTGLLATNVVGRSGGVQMTITNNMLNLLAVTSGTAAGRMRFHNATNTALWWNWASGTAGAQILADTGMKVSFDWTAANNTSGNWVSFCTGIIPNSDIASPGLRILQNGTDSGILLRNNGGAQVFNQGVGGATGTFAVTSLTHHVDLNYAFTSWADGSTVVLNAYVDGNFVLTQTFTWNGNSGTNNLEFGSVDNGTKIDNVTVTSLAPPAFISVAANPTANVPAPNYVGRPLTLSAAISGTAPVGYQWKFDNGSGFVGLTAATNTTLILANPQLSDSGAYALFATNSAGTTNTTSLSLTFINAILVATDTTADSPATNYVGHPVTLSATIGGSLPVGYQWKVDKGNGFVSVPNATNSTMTLASGQIADSGSYSLFASNGGGSTNTTGLALTFISAPAHDDLINLQFTGETPGGGAPGPAPAQTDGAAIGNPGDVWNIVFTTAGSYAGATGGTCTNATPLFLKDSANIGTAVSLKFVGDYIHNGGVGPFVGGPVANLMTGLLGVQTSRTGTLTVSNLAAGTYDLYLFGQNSGAQARSSTFNANGSVAVCGPNNNVGSLATPNNYIHLVPTVTASGVLTITFTGAASGDAQLNGLQLSGPLALPTLVLAQDTSLNTPATVYAGNTVTFTASFGGTQPITNQWMVDKGSGYVNVSGATNTTLTLTNVQGSDSGNYALFASNAAGNASSTPLALTVLPAPASLTFNVQFTGSAFGSGNAPAQTDGAVIGNAGDVWNTISNPNGNASPPSGRANATNGPLVDAFNVGTTATLDYVADYVFNGRAFGNSGPFFDGGSPDANLMTGYMGTVSGDTNRVILRHLQPGSYDLYLYASGRNDGQTRVNVFTANGQTAVCGPNNSNSVFIAGVNYVHLTPTIANDGVLTVNFYGTADAGQALMNGFQLNGPVTAPTLFLSADTSSDSPATNYVGRNVTLAAAFGGYPTPALQWKVDKGSGFVNVSATATNSSLTLVNVQATAAGSYALFASNVVGVSNSTPMVLTVVPVPTTNFGVNVNVQFIGTSRGTGFAATQTGPGVIGNAGDLWNPVSNPNPVLPDTSPIFGSGQILSDASGIGTTETLDYTGTTDLNTGGNNPFVGSGSPLENLMRASLGVENSSLGTLTLHGILPGTYDLYLYSSGPSGAAQSDVTQFTANDVSATAGPNDALNVITEGTNYVHLRPTVSGNGLLNISLLGTAGGQAQLNGLQLSGPGAFTLHVVLNLQQSGSQLTLTWPNGTLLEATNLLGPWTTNLASSPFTFTPSASTPQKFYRVQVQ